MPQADRGSWAWRVRRWVWAALVFFALTTAALAVRYLSDRNTENLHTQREGWGLPVVSLVLFALLAAAAATQPWRATARRCWLMSVAATVIFAMGTMTIWQIVTGDDRLDTVVGTPLMRPGQVDAYLAKSFPGVEMRRIPTGVFIQGVKFSGPDEVQVNGYVWQHYDEDVPKTSQGVTFPEAPDGYEAEKVYEHRRADGRLTKGWHFNLTLRQRFDYRHYPLDKQNIWLRMWTISAFENEALVPDLASYPPWTYQRKLGLDQDIVSSGWSPYFTAYSYAQHEYSMSFGAADYTSGVSGSAELYYNIGVSRSYAGPLIGKLLQSLFIAMVMFLALFVYTKDDQKNPRFGFSTWTAISFAVSLLLVIVVDQTSLREITGDTSLTYLEYFAIAQYVIIMGIFANAIMIGSDSKIRALEWRDNLLPTLLYWPLLTGLFFGFTLGVFAPE